MTIGIDLGDVWSHYCTLNQMVKSARYLIINSLDRPQHRFLL